MKKKNRPYYYDHEINWEKDTFSQISKKTGELETTHYSTGENLKGLVIHDQLRDAGFLTIDQVEYFLNIYKEDIQEKINDGEIPTIDVGGSVRIDKKDLITWLRTKKQIKAGK